MDWGFIAVLVFGLACYSGSVPAEPSDDGVSSNDVTSPSVGHHINDFGYRLLRSSIEEHADENVVMGIASVAGLLGMTLLGSVGETYDELAYSLGFSQDILANRKNHEEFGALLQGFNPVESGSHSEYADAVVLGANVKVRPLYQHFLRRVYNADALETNFTDAALARSTINEWVREHTQGKIEEFLQQPLSKKTELILLSAHYFSGLWAKPFSPEYTKKMVFHKPSGDVMADLMLNYGHFNYVLSEKHECHMIALPYNDTENTMYVLKPLFPKKMSLPTLLNKLNWTTIDDLITQMQSHSSVIRFPKMVLKSRANIKTALQAVGINSIFEPGRANFALMIEGLAQTNKTEELINRFSKDTDDSELRRQLSMLPNPGVYVETVLHEVQIIVNEYGTEAVAVTAGLLSRTAKLFYVDTPFLFFIRDQKTGLVTFSAAIFDPTSLL